MSTPRFRTKDARSDCEWTYTSPSGVKSNYNLAKHLGTRAEMWDFVTKDFHKKSSKGMILMQPMGRREDRLDIVVIRDYSVYHTYPPYATVSGPDANAIAFSTRPYYNGNVLIGSERQAQLNVEAATRCLSNIRRTSTDNWENIAEAGKTLEMLRKPVSSWLTWNKKFMLASAALSTSNAWLAYRYGVRPLIGSIEDTLYEMRRNIKPTRSITRSSSKDEETRQVPGGYGDNAAGSHNATWITSEKEEYNVRCMSIDEHVFDMWDAGGLSAKSLLTLPWELIPYSFVVDWLANVGDFIGAVAQGLFPSSLGRCETHTWKYEMGRTTNQSWVVPPLYGTPGRYSAVYTASLKQRYTSLTNPGLVIRKDFKLYKPVRLADSVALIGQQIIRRFAR